MNSEDVVAEHNMSKDVHSRLASQSTVAIPSEGNQPSTADRPWLTVVMPIHRPARWLDDALQSIVSQDEPVGAIEVIIRDSSPEGPLGESIATKYASQLAIDYAHTPNIPSWTEKTNEMVRMAKADYICTLHQDDIWLRGRASRARKLIADNPKSALIFSPSRFIDPKGRDIGGWRPPFKAGKIPNDKFREIMLVQCTIAIPSALIRRDAYLAVGGLDQTLWYTPDWNLWLDLASAGEVIFDPRIATGFRIHPDAQTIKGDRREFAEQLKVVFNRHVRSDDTTKEIGQASVMINVALSDAASGNWKAAWRAISVLAGLGPRKGWRYLHLSRLRERLLPRLRLRLSGGL